MRYPTEDFYLFLGSTDSESATSRLRAGGSVYYKKKLQSQPANWRMIVALLKAPTLQGALATFTGADYERMVSDEYADVTDELLHGLAARPHVVFVHEAVYFTPEQREAAREDDVTTAESINVDRPWHRRMDDDFFGMSREEFFGTLPDDIRQRVNSRLRDHGINVLPYDTNVERSILATAFLDDHERHLLFRVYVPSGRLYADEADTLLGLFRDWLNQTGRSSIRQDGYRTHAGQVYEFFSATSEQPGALAKHFQDFSEFLDSCADRPESALAQLETAGMEASSANRLVSRYGVAAKRLRMDLAHRREERILALKHNLEAELLEIEGLSGDALTRALARMVPQPGGSPMGVLAPAAGSLLEAGIRAAASELAAEASGPGSPGDDRDRLTLNVNQQFINHAAGEVIQNVQGTVHLGPEAKDLLELIAQFAGGDKTELETAVHELEDPDARAPDRLAARQKLKRFLTDLAAKGAGLALSTLHKYLEHKIGLG